MTAALVPIRDYGEQQFWQSYVQSVNQLRT